jgi:polyferredoxin
VQIAFFILIAFIGWRFYLFVKYCEGGGIGVYVPRPPGVEAFLPIGALVSIKYYFLTGIIDPIHPAGFIIFVTILLSALFFRRGFCSWICPVGTISEWLWRGFKGIFGNTLVMPRITNVAPRSTKAIIIWVLGVLLFLLALSPLMKWLPFSQWIYIPITVISITLLAMFPDITLRSVKYLLLAFFLHIPLVMDKALLESFYRDVPYIKVADVKMMKFFTEISTLTLIVVILFVIGSFINKNFWCRYFCPYGAVVGVLGWISPFRIARDKDLCIDCGKCTEACPVYITVENKNTISNPECLVCYDCVQACPKSGALDLKLIGPRAKIHYVVYAAILLVFFGILTTAGRLTGNWHTSVTVKEFVERIPNIHDPLYDHKQGKFSTEKGTF